MFTQISIIAVLFALTLTGCNRAIELASEATEEDPVLVLSPGYKVLIHGIPTAVFGYDLCPNENTGMAMFLGSAQSERSNTCIVLDKTRESVPVRYKTSTGVVTESWKVIRSDIVKYGMTFPTTTMRRPDNFFFN